MAIRVHRQTYLRVAEEFHYHAQMNIQREQQTGGRMAQIVKPNIRQFGIAQSSLKIVTEIRRIEPCTNPRSEREPRIQPT
jgi:hypothetical protein